MVCIQTCGSWMDQQPWRWFVCSLDRACDQPIVQPLGSWWIRIPCKLGSLGQTSKHIGIESISFEYPPCSTYQDWCCNDCISYLRLPQLTLELCKFGQKQIWFSRNHGHSLLPTSKACFWIECQTLVRTWYGILRHHHRLAQQFDNLQAHFLIWLRRHTSWAYASSPLFYRTKLCFQNEGERHHNCWSYHA